jgi:hypothetical protein
MLLVLACGLAPSGAASQDSASAPQATPAAPPNSVQPPDSAQAAQPPPPAVFQKPIPSDQLAFLKDYDGKKLKELKKDKHFSGLEGAITPSTRYFYHVDRSLWEARDRALGNHPMPITVRDGRYVMVGSAGTDDQHYAHGFLWFDIQTGIGLGGIYFHPTNGEPTPTLTIYSKQLTDTDLSMAQLPPEFYQDFVQWAAKAGVAEISPRYFIPANKKKYALLHDEDYCAHPANTPLLGGCQELSVAAAEADLIAAYFMHFAHNASDATSFELDFDQLDWLAVRERTCAGPNGAACRIQITRQRTAVLTGHPVPPHPVPVRR